MRSEPLSLRRFGICSAANSAAQPLPPSRRCRSAATSNHIVDPIGAGLACQGVTMHQHSPFDDFDAFEPEHGASRRSWILLSLILVAVLVTGTAAGYALARGVWGVPDPAKSDLPQFIAQWLSSPEPASSARPPANLKSYAFELVDAKAPQGDAIVSVRLVHKPTGRPISDAVIFGRRLDMAPEGMPTMTADLEPMVTTEPGIYRFKTNLTMQGKWQLSLAAKVQGESGTVQNKLVLEAAP